MQVRIGSAVAALVASGVAAGVARADIIEFSFHGMVDSVSGSSVLPELAGVEAGQAVTVRYTFDSEAEDLVSGSSIGRYEVLTFDVFFDDVTVAIALPQINLHNGPFTDSYFAGGEGFLDLGEGGGVLLQRGELSMFDAPNETFPDDSLPQTLPFDAFQSVDFTYRELDEFRGAFRINTTITDFSSSVVPAPTAGFVLGPLWLGIQRRRRN